MTTHNRSGEELAMRGAIEAWGRARWPDARVFHELTIGMCRADLAFICPADLIVVEIKSSRDTLDRLDKQMRVFKEHVPEVWVALAPKWKDDSKKPFIANEMFVTESAIETVCSWRRTPDRNGLCYNAMLHLLWAEEARAIAGRKSCLSNKRQPLHSVVPELALHLTGKEILEEVCRELRGRYTAYTADEPVYCERRPMPAYAPNLFASALPNTVAEREGR